MTCPCQNVDLRRLQDRWLRLAHVRYQIRAYGEDSRILMSWPDGEPWPTFREVRTTLLSDLAEWFADFFRGDDS